MRVIGLVGVATVGMAIAAGVVGYKLASQSAAHRAERESLVSSSRESNHQERETDLALRNQVAQLELKVAALTALGANPTVGSSSAPVDVDSVEEKSRPPTPEELKKEKAEWRAHMALVDADFQAEPRDSRWAMTATNLLRDRIDSDQAMRAAVRQVECRSTICRVEMIDDRRGEFGRSLPVFLQRVSDLLPMTQANSVENPDGTMTMIVYLSTTVGMEAPGSRGN